MINPPTPLNLPSPGQAQTLWPDPRLAERILTWVSGAANPSNLGISGYAQLREGQKAAIRFVCAEENLAYRVLAMNMPTGTGKSLFYMTLAQLAKTFQGGFRTLIITGSRQLQDQLRKDFASCSKDIRGKNNYLCVHDFDLAPESSQTVEGEIGEGRKVEDEGRTKQERRANFDLKAYYSEMEHLGRHIMVDTAPCNWEKGWECPTKAEGGCLYYAALNIAKSSRIVVANYAWWLANNKNQAGEFDLIVVDEAHNMEGLICSYLTADFNLREVEKLIGLKPPSGHGFVEVSRWLADGLEASRKAEENVSLSNRQRLARIKREFEKVGPHHAEDWARVFEKGDKRTYGDRLKVAPVSAAPYVGEVMREIPKVILVSATLTPITMEYLGYKKGSYGYLRVPSSFPPERRPFWVLPAARMSGKMGDEERREAMGRLAETVDEIVRLRPGMKAIIHTVSYARAKELFAACCPGTKRLMVLHDPGGPALKKAMGEFKARKGAAILVTPVAAEGVDLPYEQCRWQAIIKIPFPDTRSGVSKIKSERNKDWGAHEAGVKITQMYGRVMRAHDDWGETFMLDSAWGWARVNMGASIPKELWEAERVVGAVPRPPRH